MLSYRHSFHAGNFADVIKHIVAVEIFAHFIKKDKPFEYIDTHSGAGLFDLNSDHANKLAEHNNGIEKLDPGSFPELEPYFEMIKSYNNQSPLNLYPGSPLIAKYFLRPQDRAWLYELHPQDFKSLNHNVSNHKKIKVFCTDGLKALESLLPPISRRGFILIDPSYEVKSEYEQVFQAIKNAHKRFSTGTYALWYPVVSRQKIDKLEKQFIQSNIKNIQRFELGSAPDSTEKGMTSSGMFVVNPPWNLYKKMSLLLPKLATTFSGNQDRYFKCDILVAE